MAKTLTLNKKRLTKKEVRKIIEEEGKFDESLSQMFFHKSKGGYITAPKVYNISNNRCLFVFNEGDKYLDGKGDIYTKENLLRMANWTVKVHESYARGNGSSVSEWLYYTNYGDTLINNIEYLSKELCDIINVENTILDKSYKSLDVISQYIERIGVDQTHKTIYDHLVAYVGEVLRTRVNGEWEINIDGHGENYPYIKPPKNSYQLMPLNVVMSATDGLQPCNLRQETTNEYRRYSASRAD